MVEQKLRQLLGHSLSERGNKHTLMALRALANLFHQVVYLVFRGAHLNLWVKQTRWTDDLLHNNALGLLKFEVGRCGRDVDALTGVLLKLLEGERTVVEGGGQTETILHEIGLASPVTTIHASYLRHGDMALVDEEQEVLGEEVEQTVGTLARLTPIEVAGIVLNARAVAQLLNHLHVVLHTFLYTLRLDGVAQLGEEVHLLDKVVLNHADGPLRLLLGGHEEVGRINLIVGIAPQTLQGDGVKLFNAVYLIVPERDAQDDVVVGHVDVYGIALHAEVATLQRKVIAHVERLYQLAEQGVAVHLLALDNLDDILREGIGAAHTVNTRNTGHDHHVAPS